MANRTTPEWIQELQPGEIFVFGSNLEGHHGGGAALLAFRKWGAVWGQGTGLQGQTYGIPTMHGGVEAILPYVDDFIRFAAAHPEMTFLVTEIGCGIAGFTPEEMAPLFAGAVGFSNICLPERFWKLLKTEKEKMLAGEHYDCGDKELLDRWHLAKKLMQEYNQADTTDRALLDRILDQLLGSKGKNVWIGAPFFVDYGENIHIGNNCEINMNCVFLDCNRITIGDSSGIGPNVQIYAVAHPVNPTDRLPSGGAGDFPFWRSYSAPVTIGRNVWIGGGSIILPGVTIGDNTTIGAGSVVTRSIPANCLAAGNPCKVIRAL